MSRQPTDHEAPADAVAGLRGDDPTTRDPVGEEPATGEETVLDGEVVADAASTADELETLRAERDGLVDDLRRLQAEFANYKKRMLRDRTAHVERANEQLLEQLLPVLDNFDLALLSLDAGVSDEAANMVKGLELVYADFLGVLEKAGLARVDAHGAPFDPTEHEAVMQDDGDGEPVVTEVMRTGYTLKGRVLRPAMVKVSRARG
jgi:molecular chaperone GrpE